MPRAKTSKKPSRLATNALLLVVTIIVAYIAYKQIFLVNRLTAAFPDTRLSRGIEACVQEHFTPSMVQALIQNNAASGVKGILDNVLRGVSGKVVQAKVQQNYITETKVLQVADLRGKNAHIRVTGSVDLAFTIPVLGETQATRDYQTKVFKRDAAYFFNTLSIKAPEDNAWTEWDCAKAL